jgi:hypothetical protein
MQLLVLPFISRAKKPKKRKKRFWVKEWLTKKNSFSDHNLRQKKDKQDSTAPHNSTRSTDKLYIHRHTRSVMNVNHLD